MKLTLVEAPYDSGHRGRRMGAGPGHLLEAGLVEDLALGGHDVECVRLDLGEGFHAEVGTAFELMRRISRSVSAAVSAGRFPVVLSGNCNAAVGALSGLDSEAAAMLWFDAHGDLNTPETSLSGFFDGMGYSVLLGRSFSGLAGTVPGFRPLPGKRAAIAAARDLDPPELEHIARWGVSRFECARLRHAAGLEELEGFARGAGAVYVHVDLDALDPSELVANSLAVEDGLTVAELRAAIAAAARGAPIAGIGFASYDPSFDRSGAGPGAVREILGGVLDSQSTEGGEA